MLEREQLVAPWRGRFGILGSRGGGFLAGEVIANTAVGSMMKAGTGHSVGDDFCGFIGAASDLYVGIPSNANICSGLCAAANIEVCSFHDEPHPYDQ